MFIFSLMFLSSCGGKMMAATTKDREQPNNLPISDLVSDIDTVSNYSDDKSNIEPSTDTTKVVVNDAPVELKKRDPFADFDMDKLVDQQKETTILDPIKIKDNVGDVVTANTRSVVDIPKADIADVEVVDTTKTSNPTTSREELIMPDPNQANPTPANLTPANSAQTQEDLKNDLLKTVLNKNGDSFSALLSVNKDLAMMTVESRGVFGDRKDLLGYILNNVPLQNLDDFLNIFRIFNEEAFRNSAQTKSFNEKHLGDIALELKAVRLFSLLSLYVQDGRGISKAFIQSGDKNLRNIVNLGELNVLSGLEQIFGRDVYSFRDASGKDFIYYAVKDGFFSTVSYLANKGVNLKQNYGASVAGIGILGFRKFLTEVADDSKTLDSASKKRMKDLIRSLGGS